MIKEVDNFELFANNLFEQPLTPDEFYFVQLLVRGKDGHHVSGNNKNRLVKYYTITSKEQLMSLKEEMINISKAVTARVYIHPQKRSFKEVAGIALELTAHTYVSQNWIGMRSVFSTAAGKSGIQKDKKYLIDVDDVSSIDDPIIQKIKDALFKVRGSGGENSDKVLYIVSTKSGFHIITKAFDVEAFRKLIPEKQIDIHKNNPTLLYFAWEEK